ncbi:hypothetical protein ACRAWF_03720 [Streptomyces sp. L7]
MAGLPLGGSVDFRTAEDEDIALGGDWGPERTRARLGVAGAAPQQAAGSRGDSVPQPPQAPGSPAGLDLQYATIRPPRAAALRHFEEVPAAAAARLRELNLGDSFLPGADRARDAGWTACCG